MTATLKSPEEVREFFDTQKEVIKDVKVETELKTDGDERGRIKAVFSVFDEMDSDGDIVLSSALTNGQKVPMVWAHRWDQPVGKGRVEVQEDRAIFDGTFFLDTVDGEQAYLKVKNMEDLQEWSWGFRILDYDIEENEDAKWGYVRIIKRAELFEVSPVLVGANRNTRTLSVKSDSANSDVDNNSIVNEKEGEYVLIIKNVNGDEEFTISDELAKSLIKVVSQEASTDEPEPPADGSSEALKELARFELLRNTMFRGEC